MRSTRSTRSLIVLIMAATWACSNDSSTGPATSGTATMRVIPSTATIVPGEALHLTASLVDEFGEPLEAAVTWSSSNEAVATVSVSGNVFGRSAGRAAITASARGRTQSSAVHVLEDEQPTKPKPR